MSDAPRIEFLDIIEGWSFRGNDLNDIPRRFKKLKETFDDKFNEREQEIVSFMREVQATKEYVRTKQRIDEEDE